MWKKVINCKSQAVYKMVYLLLLLFFVHFIGCSLEPNVVDETFYMSPYILPSTQKVLLLRNNYSHQTGTSMIYVHTDKVISSKWYLEMYDFSGRKISETLLENFGDTAGTNAWVDGKKDYSIFSATDSLAIIGSHELGTYNYSGLIAVFNIVSKTQYIIPSSGKLRKGYLHSDNLTYSYINDQNLIHVNITTGNIISSQPVGSYIIASPSSDKNNEILGFWTYQNFGILYLKENRTINFNEAVKELFCYGNRKVILLKNNGSIEFKTLSGDTLHSDTIFSNSKRVDNCTFDQSGNYMCYRIEQFRDSLNATPSRYDIVLKNLLTGTSNNIITNTYQD